MASTKIRQTTYCGRRAEVKEIRTGGPTSEREIRIRWTEGATEANGGYPAGTITSHTIVGDVRKPSFRALIEKHVITEF